MVEPVEAPKPVGGPFRQIWRFNYFLLTLWRCCYCYDIFSCLKLFRGNCYVVDDVTDILAVNLIGAVPDDEQIVISTNRGEPLVGTNCLAGKAYSNICHRIMGEEVPFLNLNEKQGMLEKLKDIFKKN